MSDMLLVLGVVGVLGLVPAGYAWLGRRARRRRIGVSLMAPVEEIWDPVSHRTNIEIQVQAERLSPAPLPGDPPDGTGARWPMLPRVDDLSRPGGRGGATGPGGA